MTIKAATRPVPLKNVLVGRKEGKPVMAAYVIAQLKMKDRDTFSKYEAGFLDVFTPYDGKVLAVDEAPETLEGDWPYTRTVLLEFPSQEIALKWFNSPEYQEISKHRRAGADGNIVVVKSFGS